MPSTTRKERVNTFYRSMRSITDTHIKQMYGLYASLYENTSQEAFAHNLSQKSGVILVTRREDGRVVGFSTQTCVSFRMEGRKVRGVLSGDTIIEPAYWGRNGLTRILQRRLALERIKHPFTPLYWLLIAKSYKSYLRLTQHFDHHYPNAQGGDERYRRITQAYCEALFPDAFDRTRMLLDFGRADARLKGEAAEITPWLKESDPRIAFFEHINPDWRQGTEVPCAAALDHARVWRACLSAPLKWLRQRAQSTQGSQRPAERALALLPAPAPAWQDTDVMHAAMGRQRAS